MVTQKKIDEVAAVRLLKEAGYTVNTPDEGSSRSREGAEIKRTGKGLSAEIRINARPGDQISIEEALDNPTFTSVLQTGDINLDDYEVSGFTVNNWDVTLKDNEGNPQQCTNYQFKIKFRRKATAPIMIAVRDMIEKVPAITPPSKWKTKHKQGNRMVEIALYDNHIGMLSWKEETGENYDTSIAQKIYGDAISQIMDRVSGMKLDYFLLPIGNDFMHVDDETARTPANKNQLDKDTRLAKIINAGRDTLTMAIDRLADKAPVKVLWIPGNHDPRTSYYLLLMLDAWYRKTKRVTVDTSPMPRKYVKYGINLIGLTHGCELAKAKEKQLGLLMADEVPEYWAQTKYREFHKGHYHKKAELHLNTASTYGSIVVRDIPSISGTDYWHFQKGFTKTSKTAQFFVWDKQNALESVQDIHIDSNYYEGGE